MRFLDDAATRFAVTAERAALAGLGGGCQVPIGVHCVATNAGHAIAGVVASPDGLSLLRAELEHQSGLSATDLGEKLAQRLLDQGAERLLQASLP